MRLKIKTRLQEAFFTILIMGQPMPLPLRDI